MKLCDCGCGNPTNMITRSNKKYKKGEYHQFLAGHNPASHKVKYPNGCKICWGENYWRGYCRKHCWEDEFIKKSRINSIKKYELTDKGKLARRKSEANYIKNHPDKYKQKINDRYKNDKEKVLIFQSIKYKYGISANDPVYENVKNFELLLRKFNRTIKLTCEICGKEYLKRNSRQKTCGDKYCSDRRYQLVNKDKIKAYLKQYHNNNKEIKWISTTKLVDLKTQLTKSI